MPWAPLTSFVGREREAAELAGLVRDHRLVTVTGPGGVGKTRLAAEVARAAAGQFPDGVHFAGLGAVTDPGRVPAAVAAALGVRQLRGQAVEEVLAQAVAPRRLLLVLDNCEHVLEAAAELCGELLKVADDVRLLATSREPLWVGGEVRYRLPPLELPGSDDPAEIGRSEAVALFAERARHADPRFALGDGDAPLAARVVGRLDGMPLAIELAAARVEALGLAGLADRVDDALRLLEDRGVPAAARHRSLAAVADWSYRLLSAAERGVFRRLAVFPGPFTLEGAEAVAGPEAGPVVLRLVDCSLVAPPRRGPDGRMRYALLQTLRAFGLARLAEAGGEREAAAALAGFALSVAGQAGAGLQAGGQDGELAALRWLDAEDATLGRALGWALEDDPGAALALATALAPWWLQRGRMGEGYAQLAAAAARAAPGGAGRGGAGLRAAVAGVPVQLRGQPRQQPGPPRRGPRGRRGPAIAGGGARPGGPGHRPGQPRPPGERGRRRPPRPRPGPPERLPPRRGPRPDHPRPHRLLQPGLPGRTGLDPAGPGAPGGGRARRRGPAAPRGAGGRARRGRRS